MTGGQIHPASVRPVLPGAKVISPRPVTAMTAAGTNAHRCGWLVSRVDSTASIAQPAAKASRAEPVMTCSGAPGNATRVKRPPRRARSGGSPGRPGRSGRASSEELVSGPMAAVRQRSVGAPVRAVVVMAGLASRRW